MHSTETRYNKILINSRFFMMEHHLPFEVGVDHIIFGEMKRCSPYNSIHTKQNNNKETIQHTPGISSNMINKKFQER